MSDQPEINDFFSEPEPNSLDTIPKSSLVFAGSNQNQLMQMAEFLAQSTLVPAAYQNKPANCFLAVEYAQRIGCSPMTVIQNLDVIQGKPSWSSKFMISVANDCGRYTPIKYKMTGTKGQDDWGCIAYMTEISSGEVLEGIEVTVKMAKDEGWYGKNGSKWKTIPELMLRYRSAAFLIRTYAPELTMGLHTSEEKTDMINVTPQREETAAERAYRESQVLHAEVVE